MEFYVFMSDIPYDEKPVSDNPNSENRRDFLYLVTGSMGLVGLGGFMWSLVDSMNPAADTLAISTIEVDLSPIPEGQSITLSWRGQPLFIRHRTPQEIHQAKNVDVPSLPHPEPDESRAKKEQWLVMVGICTHLGCIPKGQSSGDPRGNYGGWFCPCHGSHYDTSGRIRQGPAPQNMVVPHYEFLSDTVIRVG